VALLFLSRNTADIYLITTKKEYRKHEVRKAVKAFGLNFAYEHGAHTVYLQVIDLGYSVYKSLSFQNL